LIIQELFYMEGVKTVKNKILSVLMTFTALFSLTACQSNTDNEPDKLQIVTTIFPQYDFVRNIAGDNAEVTLLLTPGAESHAYEPTAADISRIQQADLFIYNGGTSEVWVEKILDSTGRNDKNSLCLFDYIAPVESQHEHHEHDEAGEHEHDEETDEHIFTSLRNSAQMLDVINERICEIDAENASLYKQNSDKYKSEIIALDEEFSKMTSEAKRNIVVLGDRFPFTYFAQDYNLDCHAAFSGCSHDTEASPAVVSELIETVQKNDIPIVFHIEFSDQKIAQKIADATGAEIELLHSCHNISKDDFENNVTYLQLMKNNYSILSEALN